MLRKAGCKRGANLSTDSRVNHDSVTDGANKRLCSVVDERDVWVAGAHAVIVNGRLRNKRNNAFVAVTVGETSRAAGYLVHV